MRSAAQILTRNWAVGLGIRGDGLCITHGCVVQELINIAKRPKQQGLNIFLEAGVNNDMEKVPPPPDLATCSCGGGR